MSLVKAIVMMNGITPGDDGLGVDFAIHILESTWRTYIEMDGDYSYTFPSNDSVILEDLWYSIATSAKTYINTALTAAGQAANADEADIFVYGFGDWKAGAAAEPERNIYRGDIARIRRIPRANGGVELFKNAQETVRIKRRKKKSLKCEIQFKDAPSLGTQLEYRLYLYLANTAISSLGLDNFLVDTAITGPPYILHGQLAVSSMNATLQAADRIHCVLGLKRKAIGTATAPTNAGTIEQVRLSFV